MGYAVMTTWKHKNPIDWKEMASEDFSMMPKGTTVQWFAIDEYNHGSFATYTSKEVYDGYKAELDAYREKVSSSRELEKTLDVVGPINVNKTENAPDDISLTPMTLPLIFTGLTSAIIDVLAIFTPDQPNPIKNNPNVII